MKRFVLSVLAVALMAFGLPLLVMSPASAHTPNITATCAGVTVSGSSYEAKDTNTLGVRIDGGAFTTKTFATSGSLMLAVPQDGATHSYDAYVHTTNSNTSYSHDYTGQVGPCGDKHVTAVLWDSSPPTCEHAGALIPKNQPTGVVAHQSPAGTGPGHYTITFTPSSGYAIDGPTSQGIDVLPMLGGDQCATAVQPVSPSVEDPACTGPGSGVPGSIGLPADGGGISYGKVGTLVTATADGNHKFVSLPIGWTLVDSHHATYQVTFEVPAGYPDCLVPLIPPTPPDATAPACDTDGSLTVGPTAHVVTTVDGTVITQDTVFGPGSHTIVYAPAAGYAFSGEAKHEFTVKVGAKTLDCPATPVAPTVVQSVCNGPGTHTAPQVITEDGGHITYVYDAATTTVTATPDTGFALADLPDGWTSHDNGTATFVVSLTDPGPCLVQVDVPVAPTATAATCDTNGSLTVGTTPNVVTTVDGSVISADTAFGPGSHTIVYAPAAGYAFNSDSKTEFVVDVGALSADCPASPVVPTLTQSVCTDAGTHSAPAVSFDGSTGDHITYVYNVVTEFTGSVVATPDAGFVLAGLTAGWLQQEDGTATYAVAFTDPGTCGVVSPPTVTPPAAGGTVSTPTALPDTGAPAALVPLGGAAGMLLIVGLGLIWPRRRTI